MMAHDYDYVRDLLYRKAGIVLDAEKRYLIDSRLAVLGQQQGGLSAGEVLERLRRGRDPILERAVIDAMTTNETSFFRDAHPFEALAEDVLPDLMAARRDSRRLVIWCAACSTGQEPYTLAMLIREQLPTLLTWDLTIRATDLASDVLERAREGWYSDHEVRRGLPQHLRDRYFQRDGHGWRADASLRQMIDFGSFNLVGDWIGAPRADLVLLRNVLIYFDGGTRARILQRIRHVLAPDGYLLMGCAESPTLHDDHYAPRRIGRTTFWAPGRMRQAV